MLSSARLLARKERTPSAAPATSMIKKNTKTRIRLVRIFILLKIAVLRMVALPLNHGTFDEGHLLAGHKFFDIDQDKHALAQRTDTHQIFRGKGGAELRRGTDVRLLQHQHIRHAINHYANHARVQVQYDDDGLVVVFDALKIELDAHVDDGHDDAAQVGHALHERRDVGNTGNRLGVIAADFLDFQDLVCRLLLEKKKKTRLEILQM